MEKLVPSSQSCGGIALTGSALVATCDCVDIGIEGRESYRFGCADDCCS